jgi:cytochrome c oxidase cbb3-type subunit 4
MEFDVNTGRALVTLLGLIVFVGFVLWVYSKKNSADFDEAAKLPFDDDSSDNREGSRNE